MLVLPVASDGLSPGARDFQVALAVSREDLSASIYLVSVADSQAALVCFLHSEDDLAVLDLVCSPMEALLVVAGRV